MSYTYLLEQGEESSAASFSDIPPSVLSRLNLTAEKSYSKDNETASCQSFQSGIMSQPSTENIGEEKSMSSQVGSRVKTLALETVMELGSQESEADCGKKWQGSLAKYDLDTALWKTHQCLLFEDSTESLVIFPQWGIMLNGELWELAMSEGITNDYECGLSQTYPTPCAKVTSPRGKAAQARKGNPMDTLPNVVGGVPHPHLSEWLMAWPIGWTDLKPLEMDKFHLWLQQHGEYLEENK
jgi:hypothetical protein